MSHVYTYGDKIRNVDLFMEICAAAQATLCRIGEHSVQQYGSNKVDCVASALLPQWRYPIALTQEGSVKYDHWGASGGEKSMEVMKDIVQEYWKQSVEEVIDWTDVTSYNKEVLPNGDIEMVYEFE